MVRSIDDLENLEDLEEYVSQTAVMLLLLTRGYFGSRNCMRELAAMFRLTKPHILVHEVDGARGGAPLDVLKSELKDTTRRDRIFDGRSVSQWHRVAAFQQISLLQIAEDWLLHTQRYAKREALGQALPFWLGPIRSHAVQVP